MSRIGKKPIPIPENVQVEIKDSEVKIKGPKGEIRQDIPVEVSVEKKDGVVQVLLKKKDKKTPALWGTIRAILRNHIEGVTEGFEKKLEIRGIGYRAFLEGEKGIKLEVGFSHPVILEIPSDIKILIEKNIITVSGVDKQKVGEFAAKLRRVRPPEPYKGKGIRYLGEKVRIKEGKKVTAATTTAAG